MTAFLLYPLLCGTFFYLGSRAVITSWLWSRYPRWLAGFMDCSACAGTWLALLIAIVGGKVYHLDFLGLDGEDPKTWPVVAFAGTCWTPLISALHQKALMTLGTALEPEPEEETSVPRVTPASNDSTMPIPSTQRLPLQPNPEDEVSSSL